MKSYGTGSRILAAALILTGTLPSATFAGNGTWTNAVNSPQFWETTTNWQGGVVANDVDGTATFATAGLTGPYVVQLNSAANGVDGRTIGNLVFNNPTNNFGWTIDQGPGYFLTLATSGATAPNIAVNNANMTATLNVILQGSQGFTKSGAGNLSLTQNNDGSSGGTGLAGPIIVNGGTVTSDYSPGTNTLANILPITDVTLSNGGGLGFIAGAAQMPIQTLNSLTVNPGASAITATVPVLRNQTTVGSTALITLNLGTITRATGGLLQFSVPNIAPTANNGALINTLNTNSAGTIMGGWATMYLQPYNTVTGTATNASSGALMSWAVINASTGAIGPLGTTGYTIGSSTNNASWTAAANSLNADYSSNPGTLPVLAGSFINSLRFSGGSNQGYNIALAGGVNTISSGGILVVPTAGYNVPMSITGAGTLKSGGTNDLVVNQFNPFSPFTIAASISNGTNSFTTGGTGTTVLSGANTWTGKTYVSGGTLLATTTGALPGFNVAGRVLINSGTLAVAAGAANWTSANIDSVLASGTFSAGTAIGIDVPAASSPFTYASIVTGARGLTSLDVGTLVLTGNSTFTGPATISNGSTVSVATVAAAGSSSPLGAGSSVVFGGGTLLYTGAATSWSRPISLTTGGGTINAAGGLTLSGAVSGSSGLTVTGGAVSLSGVNTYGGPTVVSAGQIIISGPSAFPAGTDLVINAGASVQVANGLTPAFGSLSGSGTLNIGNATTLNVGGDQASGVFQGVVANGTGGALTIAKNGAGTQVFSAANTYTGGTTINAGTVQVSPQTASANPLGTNTVTLAGVGGATQATLAFRSLLPIAASGFNQDVVWKASEGTAIQAVTRGLDPNQVFYTNDVAAGSLPVPVGGMPLTRAISLNSLSGLAAGPSLVPGSSYILQPYTANNALQLGAQATGTLTLLTPGNYKTINVLANSTNGGSTMTATLNFSDSSTDVISAGSVADWFGGTPFVVGGMGRYSVATGQFDGVATAANNPRLYEIPLTLSAADQAKTLTSITFQNTVAAGAGVSNAINIFGLNGVGASAPTALTFSNNLTVTADSTLEVSGYTNVTLGTLRVGANALTLNIGAGSTVNFSGGTTLTGVATFNVPAGVIVGLGTVTDNNVGFGLTKQGLGTLTITNGTNYSPNGIVTVSQGTLLVNQPSGLPQSTVPGGVVVTGGATIGVNYGASPLWQQANVATLLTNATFNPGSFLGLDVAPGTSAANGTYALPIAGSVGISKTNTGTLILSATNSTYTGPTSVLGGTLSVSQLANGGLPSSIGQSSNAASNLTFTNGATLQYTGPTASTDRSFTFSGGATFEVTQPSTVLSLTGSGIGTGAVNKIGPGTLALAGLNSYAGGTNVNAGTLKASPGTLGTGTVTLNGGILSLASGGSAIASSGFGGHGTGWVANGASTFSPTGLPANTLQITPNTGGLSGSAWTQTQVPTGPFTVSFTYTVAAASATPADGMTIGFQNYTGGGLAAGSGNTTLSNQVNGGSGLGYQGITPSAALEINIYPPNTSGGAGSGVGALANGQSPSGFAATPTAPVNAGLVNTPTNVVIQYDGTNVNLTLSQVVNGVLNTYTAPPVPLNIASIVGSSAYFGFTGATGGSTAEQDISNFVNTFGSAYGNNVVLTQPSSTIQIGATAIGPRVAMGTLTMPANGTLNVTADPSTASGLPFGLTFTATALNGNNTFNIPNNGASGLGTLLLGALSNGTGASITVTGGGTLGVAGGTITGRLALGASSLSLGGASFTAGSLSGTSGTLSGDGAKVVLTVGSDNTTTSYGGNIVDGTAAGLSLVKAGLGTLTLSGANTYSGGTKILDGSLTVTNDSNLGTGSVTMTDVATLNYTGSSTTNKSFTGGTISLGSGVTLTVNGGTVAGGYLTGSGAVATDPTNGARFANVTAQASIAMTSNSANDRFVDFTNSSNFTVAPGVNSTGASANVNLSLFTNQGLGRVTVGAGAEIGVANFQSYGTLTVAPATAAGQVTLITNRGTSPMNFNTGSRTFVGLPGQTSAAIDLHGQNLVIAGGLFVNNGFMLDQVSSGTSIIVDYGGLYKGAGTTLVNIITQNGGKVQAGNSPGPSSFGQLTIGPGSFNNFGWQINDAGPSSSFPSAPGVGGPTPPPAPAAQVVSGWSQLQANKIASPLPPFTPSSGDLSWNASATPGNQFTFSLETLLGPTTPVGQSPDGAMADFDPNLKYVWPFLTWAGNYMGPTTDAALTADTLFDTSQFANSIVGTNGPGTFSLHFDGANKAIDLVFTPVPEPGTLALGSLAGLGLGWLARRRKAKQVAA